MSFPHRHGFHRPFVFKEASPSKLLPGEGQPEGEPAEDQRVLAESVEGYFQALASRVQASGVMDGEIPHLIGVTSCAEGSGVSTLAAGLSLALSRQDLEKVLLIDANLGRGSTHDLLKIKPASSLPDVMISGGHTALVQPGLYFLGAGNGEHKQVTASLGRRFRQTVSFLRQAKYTNVVIDMPVVTETSTTLEMAGLMDGIILVVEGERTSKERAKAALKLLREANANVIGVVFNKKKDYLPGFLGG
jgi:Mrp family chromosome partitioning ATPase